MWETESVIMLRHYVNDLDPATPTYTDQRLQELFLVAAMKVILDVSFGVSLAVDYTINLETLDIDPDPTDVKDIGFLVLVGYNAAAVLTASEFKTSSGAAIGIRDGSSAIDLKGIAREKGLAAEFYRKAYTDAVFRYQLVSRNSGQAIIGPASILSDSNGYYNNYSLRDRPYF